MNGDQRQSSEASGRMKRDRFTLMVIPDGELGVKKYRLSYRGVRTLLIFSIVFIVSLLGFGGFGLYKAVQAARVPGLEAEIEVLRGDLARMAELEASLMEAEANYLRIRHLLGVGERRDDRPDPAVPPRRPTASAASPDPVPDDRPASWPLVQTGFITQEARTGEGEPHPGVDIAVPQDSYIRAVGAGVVKAAGDDEVYGRFILVEHADGFESMYGHASRIFVAPGDSVSRHEVIALSGSTGRSTAPHLHLEIRREGEPIDPLLLLRQP